MRRTYRTSSNRKRSVVIAGHKTSLSLEDPFYLALREIAREQQVTLWELIAEVDAARRRGNLSSALRVYVLAYYQKKGAGEATSGEIAAHETRLAQNGGANPPTPKWTRADASR